jgi:hypothetical protein
MIMYPEMLRHDLPPANRYDLLLVAFGAGCGKLLYSTEPAFYGNETMEFSLSLP